MRGWVGTVETREMRRTYLLSSAVDDHQGEREQERHEKQHL
jgi:hypothetical protein